MTINQDHMSIFGENNEDPNEIEASHKDINIENCNFLYRCPLTFFDIGSSEKVAYCSECHKNVYRAYSPKDLSYYAIKGKCVSICIDDHTYITGMPAPPETKDEIAEDLQLEENVFDHKIFRFVKRAIFFSKFKSALNFLKTNNKYNNKFVDIKIDELCDSVAVYDELMVKIKKIKTTKDRMDCIDILSLLKSRFDGCNVKKIIDIRIRDLENKPIEYFKIIS